MLDILTSTIALTIINFVALFLLLRWLLFRPVNDFLEKRRQKVADEIDTARRNREESERLLAEHRQLLANSKEEAALIVQQAVQQAEQRRQEILAEAEKERETMVERAKMEIQQQGQKAVAQLRSEVSVLAAEIATKLLQRTVAVEDQDRILQQVLEELDDAYAKYSG